MAFVDAIWSQTDVSEVPFARILRVELSTESEPIYREKGLLKHAAIGGLLFGGSGAVVGAIHGSQKELSGFSQTRSLAIAYLDAREDARILSLEFQDYVPLEVIRAFAYRLQNDLANAKRDIANGS